MDRLRLPDRTGARIALLGGFWLFVGLFGGTAIWLGARVEGDALGWAQASRPAVVAALLWIPITLPAIRLAQRFPVHGERRARHGLIHLASALLSSFVLNFAFVAVEALVSGAALDLSAWGAAASSAGLRFLHVNAFVYLVIVGLAHAHDRDAGFSARSGPSSAVIAGVQQTADQVGILSGEGDAPVDAGTVYAQRLEARSGGRLTLLDVGDIEWIEADGDYARVHLGDAEHLVSERMKDLEGRLDPASFVRIHRSTIVNVRRVRELRHVSHGDYEVTLDDDTRLRVSRGRRPGLMAAVERARGSQG